MKLKPTKKNIEAEIKRIYEVDVELDKIDGFYFWCGKAASCLNESCIYVKYLSDMPIERWLSDFKSKVEDFLKWNDYDSIKEAVEKTNWDLDKPTKPIPQTQGWANRAVIRNMRQ